MSLWRALLALFTLLALMTVIGGGSPVALLLLILAAVAAGIAAQYEARAARASRS